MSEDRFILVNGISEERKFCVLLKTATTLLKRDQQNADGGCKIKECKVILWPNLHDF